MRIGGLRLFEPRGAGSSKPWARISLASWHSPHSLTWRWILALEFHSLLRLRRGWMWTTGPGRNRVHVLGLFPLLGLSLMRNNNGWQPSIYLLGISLELSQQAPMWFRDLYWRSQRTEYSREREARQASPT